MTSISPVLENSENIIFFLYVFTEAKNNFKCV